MVEVRVDGRRYLDDAIPTCSTVGYARNLVISPSLSNPTIYSCPSTYVPVHEHYALACTRSHRTCIQSFILLLSHTIAPIAFHFAINTIPSPPRSPTAPLSLFGIP